MHKDPHHSHKLPDQEWPQGFDIRAEHAEQQELLQVTSSATFGHRQDSLLDEQ
ncbi:MAG: hypothetical protein HWE39_23430 [Oceanospirillaceae bacterium]|nr:hypothetical protein [Oceanospirillaceae bacterium]